MVSKRTEHLKLPISGDEHSIHPQIWSVLGNKTEKSQIHQLKLDQNNMQTCVFSTGSRCATWCVTVWFDLRFEIFTFTKGNFDSSCVDSPNGTTYAVHRSI